jgi:quinol monooxygenase YgiN
MSSTGMVITFTTTAEGADDFAALLSRALPLVEEEAGTVVWIAGRSVDEPATFHLIDAFEDDDARNAHMAGKAAALILGEGGALLADAPTISNLSLVAAKGA